MKRERPTVKKNCEWCRLEFDAPLVEVRRGNAKFCSRSCSRSFGNSISEHTKKVRLPVECKECGTTFYVKKFRISTVKFCSKKCQDISVTIHGGSSSVEKAFLKLPNECHHCKVKSNLVLHHIDHNHYNNDPDNWRIVCRKCHVKIEHPDQMKKNFEKRRSLKGVKV
jgi:hypothetical protein